MADTDTRALDRRKAARAYILTKRNTFRIRELVSETHQTYGALQDILQELMRKHIVRVAGGVNGEELFVVNYLHPDVLRRVADEA